MGVDVKKKSTVPPLPAPTETETTFDPPSELGTDLSKPGDEKSSYSLPDDGTPVTIRTRGHRTNKSQTSLLIEYFEGGKSSSAVEQRKPSVRVRLTPSSKKTRNGRDRDHIQITETKTRKASLSRRATASPSAVTRGTADALSALSGDVDDAKSTNSYASATEESNVSRNPIDIEIDRAGHVRRRRPASPLIPTMESKASYQQTNMSDISAIPTDSFLDGSGNTASLLMSDTKPSRNRSPSRLGGILAGATAGVAATAAAEKLSATSRERDRVMVTKSRDKERKNKSSKSRTSSKEERHIEDSKSPRGRSTSSKGPPDTAVSAVDSSVLSSNLSQSHRSYDQHSIRSGASKASSINNPKLLETVEDAIRRLILPELNALKREQSKHKERRSSTTSSATSISRDEYGSGKRRSAGTDKNLSVTRDSLNLKERRDREARHDCEDVPSPSLTSKESIEKSQHVEDTPVRSHEHLKSMALGASLGGPAALAAQELLKSHSEEKRSRRRRRAEMRSRGTSELSVDSDDEAMTPVPPMPLMSETNHSEMTRTSILSAETDRPQSATEELTPSHDVTRSLLSAESSPTPTRNTATLQALGTQHANISHGDLRALPRHREIGEEPESDEIFRVPAPRATDEEYDDQEYYERSARMDDEYSAPTHYNYYGNTQDVPPPLKYVPYQAERRGLSPIPSVSGYTEGGSEPPNRDSRVTHRDSVDSPDKSTRHDGSIRSRGSILSNAMGRDYVEDDRSMRSSGAEYRNPGYTEDSELDHVVSGKTVRAVGANPDFVHPAAIESNVASLVDTSTVDESVLTGESGHGGKRLHSPRQSMATLEEGRFRELGVPEKSVADREEFLDDREVTPVSAGHQSRAYLEYEPDEYGRKVPMRRDRQSPTESEAAITGAAVGAAAAALRAQQARAREEADEEHYEEEFVPAGIQRNKSFKERTLNGRGPGAEPRHGADWYDEPDNLTMGFSGIPRPDQPMPDAEWPEDDGATNPSIVHEQSVVGQRTPRAREKFEDHANAHHNDFQGRDAEAKQDDHGFGISESTAVVAGAAALAGAVAMAAAHHDSHSRQASQDQGEEWYRNSEDRKRDTIVTNPYEGTSPIANLPGLNENLLGRGSPYRAPDFGAAHARSPLGHKVDEGYISQGPNKTPELQVTTGKGVDFDMQPAMGPIEDPFYAPHERPLSGLSGGVGSPLYDAATGTGIDRIESKDIMALMQHVSTEPPSTTPWTGTIWTTG